MKALSLGIAGLGTVGSGVVRLLQKNADLIAARAGVPVRVAAVAARRRDVTRACDLSGIPFVDHPMDLAAHPDVDVVVELMGGADGIAHDVTCAALRAHRSVVTANKAMLAAHGRALAHLAQEQGVHVMFEAAVAGGIPVIAALRDSLAANRITRVRGILNGTCNFILTRMEAEKMDFARALKEAQDLGYAEADPAADVDGPDSANKLALLAALAFGTVPALGDVEMSGIRDLTALDIDMAAELGYRIKLLGVAMDTPDGILQRVGPCLVPQSASLADVGGVLNAVEVEGDAVGPLTLVGRGAGGDATASAVVGDCIALARGTGPRAAFGLLADALRPVVPVPMDARQSRWYVRLSLRDQAGVLAHIAQVFGEEGVSIATVLQKGRSTTEAVPVILLTHAAHDAAFTKVLARLAQMDSVAGKACCLRVEKA